MKNYEFGKYNSEPTKEIVDLDAKYDPIYFLGHHEKMVEILSSFENEERRRSEMEKDASLKADKIHEEIVFYKGVVFQKMVHTISSVLNDGGVTTEVPDNVNIIDKEDLLDYLISECMRFDYKSIDTICQAVSDGLFDSLGLRDNKRPALILIDGKSGVPEDMLGCFDEVAGYENGIIRIYLSNFDNRSDIRKVLATLEHECFHVYQFNCRRGMMPIETMRDRVIMAAYGYGIDQYISSENDFEGYYDQGYESSARIFSNQLTQATNTMIKEAIKTAMKGDKNE